jgi:hypothetical protein
MKEENIIYQKNVYTKYKGAEEEGFMEFIYKIEHTKIKDLLKNNFEDNKLKLVIENLVNDNLISIIENSINDKVFVVWEISNEVRYIEIWNMIIKSNIKDCLTWIKETIKEDKNSVISRKSKIVINKINEV